MPDRVNVYLTYILYALTYCMYAVSIEWIPLWHPCCMALHAYLRICTMHILYICIYHQQSKRDVARCTCDSIRIVEPSVVHPENVGQGCCMHETSLHFVSSWSFFLPYRFSIQARVSETLCHLYIHILNFMCLQFVLHPNHNVRIIYSVYTLCIS